jgi:hypothetical protein
MSNVISLKTRQILDMDEYLIYLESDSIEGIVTPELYKEITLQMSSGDFGAHVARKFYKHSSDWILTCRNDEVLHLQPEADREEHGLLYSEGTVKDYFKIKY